MPNLKGKIPACVLSAGTQMFTSQGRKCHWWLTVQDSMLFLSFLHEGRQERGAISESVSLITLLSVFTEFVLLPALLIDLQMSCLFSFLSSGLLFVCLGPLPFLFRKSPSNYPLMSSFSVTLSVITNPPFSEPLFLWARTLWQRNICFS